MIYLPKDFVMTMEGLVFAVVDRCDGVERIPCFLRYRPSPSGDLTKVTTEAAHTLLREQYPKYLYRCQNRQALLHGPRPADVVEHLRPRDRVHALFDARYSRDAFEARTVRLVRTLAECGIPSASVGVTGSVLVASHRVDSDIDLVIYDENDFHAARTALPELIRQGVCAALDDAAWHDACSRRGCALSFSTFLWHEQRKRNKAIFEGTKFDLSLVTDAPERGEETAPRPWHKRGSIRLRARVTDDHRAFHYPARLGLDHPTISEVLAYTATYTGQAGIGEQIEVCGLLEENDDGAQRIIVGTDRESLGQYIRVLA
ncbi:MAG: hypothetical protein WBG92_17275 [Thiohalocapsa sp.]